MGVMRGYTRNALMTCCSHVLLICVAIWINGSDAISIRASNEESWEGGGPIELKCFIPRERFTNIYWIKDDSTVWSLNGDFIVDLSPNHQITRGRSKKNRRWVKLFIETAQRKHTGSYRCVAEDPIAEERVYDEVRVHVKYVPKQRYPKCSFEDDEGDSPRLSCISEPGSPEVRLVWGVFSISGDSAHLPSWRNLENGFLKQNVDFKDISPPSVSSSDRRTLTCSMFVEDYNGAIRSCSITEREIYDFDSSLIMSPSPEVVGMLGHPLKATCTSSLPRAQFQVMLHMSNLSPPQELITDPVEGGVAIVLPTILRHHDGSIISCRMRWGSFSSKEKNIRIITRESYNVTKDPNLRTPMPVTSILHSLASSTFAKEAESSGNSYVTPTILPSSTSPGKSISDKTPPQDNSHADSVSDSDTKLTTDLLWTSGTTTIGAYSETMPLQETSTIESISEVISTSEISTEPAIKDLLDRTTTPTIATTQKLKPNLSGSDTEDHNFLYTSHGAVEITTIVPPSDHPATPKDVPSTRLDITSFRSLGTLPAITVMLGSSQSPVRRFTQSTTSVTPTVEMDLPYTTSSEADSHRSRDGHFSRSPSTVEELTALSDTDFLLGTETTFVPSESPPTSTPIPKKTGSGLPGTHVSQPPPTASGSTTYETSDFFSGTPGSTRINEQSPEASSDLATQTFSQTSLVDRQTTAGNMDSDLPMSSQVSADVSRHIGHSTDSLYGSTSELTPLATFDAQSTSEDSTLDMLTSSNGDFPPTGGTTKSEGSKFNSFTGFFTYQYPDPAPFATPTIPLDGIIRETSEVSHTQTSFATPTVPMDENIRETSEVGHTPEWEDVHSSDTPTSLEPMSSSSDSLETEPSPFDWFISEEDFTTFSPDTIGDISSSVSENDSPDIEMSSGGSISFPTVKPTNSGLEDEFYGDLSTAGTDYILENVTPDAMDSSGSYDGYNSDDGFSSSSFDDEEYSSIQDSGDSHGGIGEYPWFSSDYSSLESKPTKPPEGSLTVEEFNPLVAILIVVFTTIFVGLFLFLVWLCAKYYGCDCKRRPSDEHSSAAVDV